MLAFIGFSVSGLLLLAFALSFHSSINRPAKLALRSFVIGYALLGLAFLVWGLGSLQGDHDILVAAVLAGDALLLLASLAMLDVAVSPKYRKLALGVGLVVAAAVFASRLNLYPPAPELKSGVLLFNTQRPVGIAIGSILALVWLPAGLKVAKRVAGGLGENQLYSLLTSLYALAVLASLMFLAARQVRVAVLAFSLLSVSFALLVASNMAIAKIFKVKHG